MTHAPHPPAAPFAFEQDPSGPTHRIVTIRLEQGDKPVVVLDQPLIQRLEATLNALPPDTRGLVLASASTRVFVAGADLKTISEASDSELNRYLAYGAKVFGMLASRPFPTVAAINGAALGGGLELAMHCDHLVAAPSPTGKPYPVGLPEAGLGLCPGWGGTNLLPARLSDPADAITRTCSGQTMPFDQAATSGLFTKVAHSPEALLATAKDIILEIEKGTLTRGPISHGGRAEPWKNSPARAAKTLAAMNALRADLPKTEPTAAVLDAINTGLTRGYQASLESERAHLVRLRHTAGAKAALEAFFAKSKA